DHSERRANDFRRALIYPVDATATASTRSSSANSSRFQGQRGLEQPRTAQRLVALLKIDPERKGKSGLRPYHKGLWTLRHGAPSWRNAGTPAGNSRDAGSQGRTLRHHAEQMNSRHPLFDYLHRFSQVRRVVVRQMWVLARRRWKREPLRGHELLREGFEEVGGSFLKLGQIMSLQVDLLPKEDCDALLALLDRVPTPSRQEVAGRFIAH